MTPFQLLNRILRRLFFVRFLVLDFRLAGSGAEIRRLRRLAIERKLARRQDYVIEVAPRRLFLDVLQCDWLIWIFLRGQRLACNHDLSIEGPLDKRKLRTDVDLKVTRID